MPYTDEEDDENPPELQTFNVSITYQVKLPTHLVERYTDDGHGTLTALVFAAAIQSQGGNEWGWLGEEHIESCQEIAELPSMGVYYQASEVDINYEGVS
jgi:hypothetical protein